MVNDDILKSLEAKLQTVESLSDLNKVHEEFLGKTSYVQNQFLTLRDLPPQQRQTKGYEINKLKNQLQEKILLCKEKIQSQTKQTSSKDNTIDITIPGRKQFIGGTHPMSQSIRNLKKICRQMAFEEKTGPQVETDWYNFTALNIPQYHPAKSMQDTFYIKNTNVENKTLLRTHTSNVQIRALEKEVPPLRFYSIGTVYRSDDLDSTHSPVFHQIEGVYIDKYVNMGHLKQFLTSLLKEFFGENLNIRFRPSYFPFTEPSAEVDILWKGKWIEVLGCGMIHREVFKHLNIIGYTGFAFGVGVERLTMIKYGIGDIRHLSSGSMEFAKIFNQV